MIIETISHRLYNAEWNTNCYFERWSVDPYLIIGGSILDDDDYRHLQHDLDVGAVINVETEHSDTDKGIAPSQLCEAQVRDDGTPFPAAVLEKVLTFARKFLVDEPKPGRLYVHCQMGGSRSPAFAYGILRYCYGFSPTDALRRIQEGGGHGDYGNHPYHQTYLRSIEDFFLRADIPFLAAVNEHLNLNALKPERKPTMEFTNRLVNRRIFPTKHIVVCEDDLDMQAKIAAKFSQLFDPQGYVQISYVPGAVQAAAVIIKSGVELILLDHDMPFGNGPELLAWMKNTGFQQGAIPVLTFSGIDANNDALMVAGATHKFNKTAVLEGAADEIILKAVDLWIPPITLPSL